MLGLIILLGFWIAIALIIVIPLIITFTIGGWLAEQCGFEGLDYLVFIILFYTLIFCLMVLI